jgi:hypothetical protein
MHRATHLISLLINAMEIGAHRSEGFASPIALREVGRLTA